MAFTFPLGSTSAARLSRLTLDGEEAGADLPDLSDVPVRGFVRGFIDMILEHQGRFWLIDWKSNYLGNERVDYDRQRLSQVMRREHYSLQYHLYTAALHRFLAARVPGYSYRDRFGGVLYVFLRGFDLDPRLGVFEDRPEQKTLDRLEKELGR
jgi:exodeoxyribonuclease V beta subunit